jgi:hypothetical protein
MLNEVKHLAVLHGNLMEMLRGVYPELAEGLNVT